MKRRSLPKGKRTRGRYSEKMKTGNFRYGGFINKLNQRGQRVDGALRPTRRCLATTHDYGRRLFA